MIAYARRQLTVPIALLAAALLLGGAAAPASAEPDDERMPAAGAADVSIQAISGQLLGQLGSTGQSANVLFSYTCPANTVAYVTADVTQSSTTVEGQGGEWVNCTGAPAQRRVTVTPTGTKAFSVPKKDRGMAVDLLITGLTEPVHTDLVFTWP